jgi:hypothetical protein
METLAKLKRVGSKDQLFMDIKSLKKSKNYSFIDIPFSLKARLLLFIPFFKSTS